MYDEEKRIAVIGVGNILMGDEGIGIHVIEELRKTPLREKVELIDAGTAFFSIVSELANFDKLIIIDVVRGGEEPGAIYRFEIGDIEAAKGTHISLHDVGIYEALRLEGLVRAMAKRMGERRVGEEGRYRWEPDH